MMPRTAVSTTLAFPECCPAMRPRCHPRGCRRNAMKCRLASSAGPLMSFEKDQPDDHKDQPQQKHKNGDTVDPMHVLHPLSTWRIRIALLDVEIFPYLSPDSHFANV